MLLNTETGVRTNLTALATFVIRYNMFFILAALIIIATILSPVFLTDSNLFNLFRQQVTYLMIAMGMFMVILTGGIDLSVSAVTTIGSIMVAIPLQKWGFENSSSGLFLSIVIGIAICVACGAINGALVAFVKIPAFIVTLATMTAAEGVAFILTNGTTLVLDKQAPAVISLIGFAERSDPVLGVPLPCYLALGVVVVIGFVMSYTTFGRLVYVTGSNENAARLAGVNTKKYIFWVYVITGAMCGLAGVVLAARTGSATPVTVKVDLNLSTIASVVIGGASLFGGEGKVGYTVVGVFIIAIIGNIMNLISMAVYPQMIVKGIIIILAVVLKSVSSKIS